MWGNRLNLEVEPSLNDRSATVAGFMAVPAILMGVADPVVFQQQLYHWAYEQAKQSMLAPQRATLPDLFAIMN